MSIHSSDILTLSIDQSPESRFVFPPDTPKLQSPVVTTPPRKDPVGGGEEEEERVVQQREIDSLIMKVCGLPCSWLIIMEGNQV